MKNTNPLVGVLVGLILILIAYNIYFTNRSNNLLKSYQLQQTQIKYSDEDPSDLNIKDETKPTEKLVVKEIDLCPKKTFKIPPYGEPVLTDKYIEVISPKGDEVYHIGDVIEVKWKNCNIESKGVGLIIEQDNPIKDCNGEASIARGVPMTQGINSYEYKIPSFINECFSVGGDTYTIAVGDGMVGGVGHGSQSGHFTILKN